MPRTALGKRSRSSRLDADQVDLPAKKPRLSDFRLASEAVNNENQDPALGPDGNIDAEPDAPLELPAKTRRRTQRATKQALPEAVRPKLDHPVPEAEASPPKPIRSQLAQLRTTPLTPTTPRHRDALASSPATPRHVVQSAGKLFQRLTPQSPLSPASQTVYHAARHLFSRGASPGELVGREDEKARLQAFLGRCSSSKPGGCLYVSGPPGTGKSAMITHVTEELAGQTSVRKAYINCMSIKSTKDLYGSLLEQLGQDSEVEEGEAMEALEAMLLAGKADAAYVVVLDEIDHVVTLGLESLYRLFEWSLHKKSRMLLVGIANALDLTDRFLPRLKAKNLKPELLPFHPYTAAQIKNIITTRLRQLLPNDATEKGFLPFIHPAAIELCSRKVSSQTGDLRKAFDICRRSLDLVEAETRRKYEDEAREKLVQQTPSRKPLGERANSASPTKPASGRDAAQMAAASLKALTPETAPRVSIAHLNKVTAASFSQGTSHRLKALNLQQKAALCALVAIEQRNREARQAASTTPSKAEAAAAPTLKALFDAYCKLCTQDAVLHPLSSSEFREVASSLEALGLVDAVDGRTGSLAAGTPSKRGRRPTFAVGGDDKRVASCVALKEAEQLADGPGADILRSILSGEALE